MKETSKTTSKAGALIASIAGLTAAAVGAYYLYGHKDAAKNRAKVKGWMLKAKGEVLEELEKTKDVTESAYMGAIDTVAEKYRALKNIDIGELETFLREMRDHWHGIQRTVQNRGRKAVGKAKKTPAKKVVRKSK